MLFFADFVLCIGFVIIKLKKESQTIYKKNLVPQSYKTQIKIQPYRELA